MRILSVGSNHLYNKKHCPFKAKQQSSGKHDSIKGVATGVLLASGILFVLDDGTSAYPTKKTTSSDKIVLTLACLSALTLGVIFIKESFSAKEK